MMTQRKKQLLARGRHFRALASTFYIAAGAFYILAPPRTTARFLEASWPAILWGAVMVAGGIVAIRGLQSRVLQTEQLGILMLLVATTMLALTQTAVAVDSWTLTRGGGTFVLWALCSFALARYSELSADIRSARAAREIQDAS